MNKRRGADKPEGFDSYEELYISWYLEELKNAGFIIRYDYQPNSFLLSSAVAYTTLKPLKTKFKEESHTILQPHAYTPDYRIMWSDKAFGVFAKALGSAVNYEHSNAFFWSNIGRYEHFTIIDVKPFFDMHNMTRQFIINQKWLYAKEGVYCQKVIPEHLFKKTFTPQLYLLTNKSGKPRKIEFATRTLSEFISGAR